MDVGAAQKRCLQYRRRILEISQTVTALHVAPAFSCIEITDLIYHELIRKDAKGKLIDSFIMSKGHGCLIQYVILEALGILSRQQLSEYCKPTGILGAHPDYGIPGIEAATGSLGHGLGIACGMAYADKLQNIDRITYVVLSDGELQEGSTWEAIMMAANLQLDNLIVFLDLNDFGGLARMSEGHPAFYPVIDKLHAFGWQAYAAEGHSSLAMYKIVQNKKMGSPTLLACNTIKGKGVSYMEAVPIWHYRSPNSQEYAQALQELSELAL